MVRRLEMVRRKQSTIEDRIKKAEVVLVKAKEKYDAALDELAKLVEKRKQQDDKKVLAAYHAGNKTADEIVAFIESNDSETV